MKKHLFLFKPDSWIGEGNIILNMVEEELSFYTKWNIKNSDNAGKILASQEIQIDGISENMLNNLIFFDFTSRGFNVEMENISIGKVIGNGIYDEKMIAWEIRDKNFEGFETYYKQEDGSYLMHSEYVTSDQFRTQIDGRIWKSKVIN